MMLLVSWCLGVNWPPVRHEDWEIILLGPWGIDLIPFLLSLVLRQWSLWSAVDCSQRAAATLSGPAIYFVVLRPLNLRLNLICLSLKNTLFIKHTF